MMKQEVVKRGWLSDAQSSKKLKGEWKKASTLGMHLSAKYSGAHEPKFANVDLILPFSKIFSKNKFQRSIFGILTVCYFCLLHAEICIIKASLSSFVQLAG